MLDATIGFRTSALLTFALAVGACAIPPLEPAPGAEAPEDLGASADAVVPPIDCSVVSCVPADQPTIGGHAMFNEQNFATIVDGFGRTRKFFVHIPATYDAVDGTTQKVPVIFAFHGGGQTREAMIDGKWGDYFDQDYAFVIPLGAPDPCDNLGGNGKSQWMQPGLGPSTSPGNPNCDPATQVVTPNGTLTYWNASLPGSFTDVLFIEELRAMVLSRFPKLNANKVYATGFSSGGGMTFTLACYRASLFRGFSVVAKTLGSDSPRGDHDFDGVIDIDPQSLVATCGKNVNDPGHATGIASPEVWGSGFVEVHPPGLPAGMLPVHRTKPFALFAGDQDNTMQEINDTGAFIRDKNNLDGTFVLQNPFLDIQADNATTQRRTFKFADDPNLPYSTFRRFLVQGVAGVSGTHAMPDAEECGAGNYFMTCDYSYTEQTKIFLEEHADLSLAP